MKIFQTLSITLLCFALCACAKKTKPQQGLMQQKRFYQIDSHLIAGNPKGRFTLVEFFDYRCHVCADAFPAIQKLKTVDPQVRIIYREVPFLGALSDYAARAALAAAFQGKYLQLHDALMAVGPGLDKSAILYLAKKQGLDLTILQKDMSSPFVVAQLQVNKRFGKQLAIQGAPVYLFAQTHWQHGLLTVGKAYLLEGRQTFQQLQAVLVNLNV